MENVLVLGTFDGVHRAHRELISEAKKTGCRVTVCTFDIPPAEYFNKTDTVLTLPKEKEELLKKSGADEVFIQKFDGDMAKLSPEEYIQKLVAIYSPKYIVVGFNHKFGKGASGTVSELCLMGKNMGFSLITVPPYKIDNVTVSSTEVRKSLFDGNVENAKLLLGRNYSFSGITVHGRNIGHTIGFPTVNSKIEKGKMLPLAGVYASICTVDGKKYKGMTNIGTNPTVTDENKMSAETHILGFNGDIYGKDVKIEFVKRLRGEVKFDSVEKLAQQLAFDAILADSIIKNTKNI